MCVCVWGGGGGGGGGGVDPRKEKCRILGGVRVTSSLSSLLL